MASPGACVAKKLFKKVSTVWHLVERPPPRNDLNLMGGIT